MTSQKLVKTAKLKLGLMANVNFHLVDADALEIPEELQALLDQDIEAKEKWNSLTLGSKRGLIHYISSAKRSDSRIARSLAIMEKAKMGLLHAQKK